MKYEGRIGKQFKSFEVKELSFNGESRTISGYAAVFNNKDKAGDILIKGCFAKSIQDRGPESQANDKIIMLWQHDQHEPIGKITKLIEDEKLSGVLDYISHLKGDELKVSDFTENDDGSKNYFLVIKHYDVWFNVCWYANIFH